MVQVTKTCIMCGKPAIVALTQDAYDRWQNGEYIQNVVPEMSADVREMLISGTHPDCWDKMFSEPEF